MANETEFNEIPILRSRIRKLNQVDKGIDERVEALEEPRGLTPPQVKTKYESNPDTNVFDDEAKNKLDNIEEEANKYVHPSTHDADIVKLDTTNFNNNLNYYTDDVQKLAEIVDNIEIEGDMKKSVYDSNDNGKVDLAENSEKVNGYTVESSVPFNANFEDTTYSDAEIKTKYLNNNDTNNFDNVSKNKLDNIDDNANNYSHPTAHPSTMITVETNTFDGNLSSNDNTVQKALETIDSLETVNPNYMAKSEYDSNGDGKVDNADNADTVNGLTVETRVPPNAEFGNTTYTDEEIKTKYENNPNTNRLTDNEKMKLSLIEISESTDLDFIREKVQAIMKMFADQNEATGFIRESPETMPIMELAITPTKICGINFNGDYYERNDGTFATGTRYEKPATQFYLYIYPRFFPQAEDVRDGEYFSVYIEGNTCNIDEGKELLLNDDSGLQFIYFNRERCLEVSYAYTHEYFENNAIVSIVYINGENKKLVNFGDERHGIQMDGFTHRYLHNTQGTQYVKGMGIEGLSEGSDTLTQIRGGEAYDEDLEMNPISQQYLPTLYLKYDQNADRNYWNISPADNKISLMYDVNDNSTTGAMYNKIDVNGHWSLDQITDVQSTWDEISYIQITERRDINLEFNFEIGKRYRITYIKDPESGSNSTNGYMQYYNGSNWKAYDWTSRGPDQEIQQEEIIAQYERYRMRLWYFEDTNDNRTADFYIRVEEYNEDDGGNWGLTYFFLTNNAQYPYAKMLGQKSYESVAEARRSIEDGLENITTRGLPTPEYLILGVVITDRNGNLVPLTDGSLWLDLRKIEYMGKGSTSVSRDYHNDLIDRDLPNAHPISSITNLEQTLNTKANNSDCVVSTINIQDIETYRDDTEAGNRGLIKGDVYATSTGELRIKL